jgi:hypothetical protein
VSGRDTEMIDRKNREIEDLKRQLEKITYQDKKKDEEIK